MKTTLKGIVFVLFVLSFLLFNSCSFRFPNYSVTRHKTQDNVQYGIDMQISGQTSGLVPGEKTILNFKLLNHMKSAPKSISFTSSHIPSDVFSKYPSDSEIDSKIAMSLDSMSSTKASSSGLLNIYFDYPFEVSKAIDVKNSLIMFYVFYFVKYDNTLIIHWPDKSDVGKTFFLSLEQNHEPIQVIKAIESVGRKYIYLKFTLKNMKNGQFYYKKGMNKAVPLFDDSYYNVVGFSAQYRGNQMSCDVGYFESNGMANVVCQMPYSPEKYASQKQIQVSMNYVYIVTRSIYFSFNLIQ